jgi:hypothetical protein
MTSLLKSASILQTLDATEPLHEPVPGMAAVLGFIVESMKAAAQVKANLIDPDWGYPRVIATFDYERRICLA